MRPLVAHSRSASAPYLAITSSGTYRLKPSAPVDRSRSRLDSFLPCSLRPQPEISAVRHGTRPKSSSDCTTEEKSQVLMISNASTRSDIGASPGSVPPRAHPSLICGVSDDVIQVSITSGSGVRSADPQDGQDAAGGAAASGSTGRSCSRASTGVAQARQNHTGNGTP